MITLFYCIKRLIPVSILLVLFALLFNQDKSNDFFTFTLFPSEEKFSNIRNVSFKHKKTVQMLFYTPFYAYTTWPYFQPKTDYLESCGFEFKNCELEYDISRYENADLIFFHARNMPSMNELYRLKQRSKRLRNKRQYWVYFNMENPLNSPDVASINQYFDFLVGYRKKSDLHFPYGSYVKLSDLEKLAASNIQKNYAKGKTNKIAWFVSHCGAIREKLVQRFMEMDLYIDVGGDCSKNYNTTMACKDRSCIETLKTYKFYFAAENNLCDEYISEKYWERSLNNELIPIVLGGTNYSDPKMAIPGSYINAFDFHSPKELVEYIKKVDANDTLYNQYFEWKKKYKHMVDNSGCSKILNNFCTKLHDGIPLRKDALVTSIDAKKECYDQEMYYHEWVKI